MKIVIYIGKLSRYVFANVIEIFIYYLFFIQLRTLLVEITKRKFHSCKLLTTLASVKISTQQSPSKIQNVETWETSPTGAGGFIEI